eukprot:GHRR01004945.1.p1 GENE.GHRR01004945.1~~GHRR01004945.1.p1  ORF type:complete len:627 (+),score=298.58 GHRR01004945.1:801-2681(+)
MCPAVLKGEVCELGSACPHSHHVFESWLHPQKFRTMLCKDGANCKREVCFFAHGAEQLRVLTRDMPHLGGPSRLRKQVSLPTIEQEQARQQAGATSLYNATLATAGVPAAAASAGIRPYRVQQQQQQQQQQLTNASARPGGYASGSMLPPFANMQLPNMPAFPEATTAGMQATGLQANGSAAGNGACWPVINGSRPCRPSSSEANNAAAMMSGEVANGSPGQQPPAPTATSPGGLNGLNGDNMPHDMRMLLASLVQEVKASRQEAQNSRNAAAQAQQQLQALTAALQQGQGLPTPTLLQQGEAAAAMTGSTSAAMILQQQNAASGMKGRASLDDLALAQRLQSLLMGQDATTDGHHSSSMSSGMNYSGPWLASPSVLGMLSAHGTAAQDGSSASVQQQLQAANAAGLMGNSCSVLSGTMLSGPMSGTYGGSPVMASVPSAAGADWQQFGGPASQGLGIITDGNFLAAAAAAGCLNGNSSGRQLSGMLPLLPALAPAVNGVSMGQQRPPQGPSLSMQAAAAAAAQQLRAMTSFSAPASAQQLASEYLLQLQTQHDLPTMPNLSMASNRRSLDENRSFAHTATTQMHSWGNGADDTQHSSSTLETGLISHADVMADNPIGGAKQLGWL